MKAKVEQTPATNLNPVLSVTKEGTVVYSNKASEPLLYEWGVEVGEKLPSSIREIVQGVISRNSPEKLEVKVGNKVYLVVFHPLPEQECVNVSGFDISDQKESEEETKESEERLKALMDHNPSLLFMKDECGRYVYLNNAYEKQFVHSKDWYGKTDFDFWPKESAKLFRANDSLVLKSGKTHQFMEDSTDLNGKRYCWLDYKFPFIDSKNKEYVGGIAIDATDRVRAEEALRESEERFRSAFDDSAVAMSLVSPDVRLLKVNEAFCQLLGFEKSEIEGHTFLDFTHPDDKKQSALEHKAVINGEKPFLWIEKRYVHKDGRVIWCEVSSSPVFDSKGYPLYTVAHIQDITERKRAEEALKKAHDNLEEKVKEGTTELEKTYKSLIESEKGLDEAQKMAHIGNWVWDIATDKAYWSNELYRIFGRDPQKLAPSINEFYNYIHPDDRHDIVNLDNKALNEKSSLCKECRILSDDGEERRVHMQSEIIFDEENVPIRIKGIVQDITERKKAEEKIHHLANIVESSEDAIGTLALDGTIISWNKGAEKVYGYSVEEILGKCVSTLAPPHLDKETIKLIEKIKQREQVNNYETLRSRKDGRTINVSITLSPVFDTFGKLTAVSFITRDITKRKVAEEALAKIEIARKQEIHHRIKNNLQVISSMLDLQAEKFNNREDIKDSEVKEAFRESQDRVISMALIHEELHKGGEIDKLNFSVYIVQLVDNLFLTYRLGNENISLNMSIDEDIFFDMDTAVPVGILINELVSNSLKHAFYGRNKGEIRIKLHREESKNTTFTLSVSDNGVGIPEDLDIEDLDSLGLQLVTSLVDQLDGTLELKRNNGTEFIIRFTVMGKNDQVSAPISQQLVE